MKEFNLNENDIVRIINMQSGIFQTYIDEDTYYNTFMEKGDVLYLGACSGVITDTVKYTSVKDSIYMIKVKLLAKINIEHVDL